MVLFLRNPHPTPSKPATPQLYLHRYHGVVTQVNRRCLLLIHGGIGEGTKFKFNLNVCFSVRSLVVLRNRDARGSVFTTAFAEGLLP